MSDETSLAPAESAELVRHIEDKVGFATSYYNQPYLNRRITARIRRTDCDTCSEYLEYLRGNEEEADALLDSLSINVTGFFRNPEMWEQLRPILRELTDEHRRITIWSAPCSDGREPYSLAMLALEDPDIDATGIDIRATDISHEALAEARAGVYQTTRTTDIEDELGLLDDFSTFIERDGDRFEVRDRVTEMVTFRHHDLIQEDAFTEVHLALCRNLLIYIAEKYKEPIIDTLDSALIEGGYLVIGMTESLPTAYKSRYDPVDKRSRIHCKRPE